MTKSKPKHILFIVREDWYFLSHRRNLAIAAREMGCKISIFCSSRDEHFDQLDQIVDEIVDWPSKRNRLEIAVFLNDLLCIYKQLRRPEIDLYHCVGAYQILFSVIANRACCKRLVCAFGGFGRLGNNNGYMSLFIAKLYFWILSIFDDNNIEYLVQNESDRVRLVEALGKARSGRIRKLKGAGWINLRPSTR